MKVSKQARNQEIIAAAMQECHRPGKDLEDDTRRERDFLYSLFVRIADDIRTGALRQTIATLKFSQARVDARVEEIQAAAKAAFRAHPCTESLCQVLQRHASTCQFYESNL